eukprot:Awhi_evm2s8637
MSQLLWSPNRVDDHTDKKENVAHFHLTERQGPGTDAYTLRALELASTFFDNKSEIIVADIGAGTGASTIILAKNVANATITAVDLSCEFLQALEEKATKQNVQDRIKILKAPMEDLSFEKESLDAIWSEGAIYNIGFATGESSLSQRLLGLRVTKEINDHWNREYPDIDTASNKIRILEAEGFSPLGYFPLGVDAWMDSYYSPLKNQHIPEFLKKYSDSKEAKAIVEEQMDEIQLYEKYKAFLAMDFILLENSLSSDFFNNCLHLEIIL